MKRRQFHLSAMAALVPAASRAADAVSTRVIDTHTHFYDPGKPGGIPWPAAHEKELYRRVLPRDWQAVAGPCGVQETVVIEASGREEDNQWVLDLAEREKCIVGFVGNLDPCCRQFSDLLGRFSANKFFRGLRWGGIIADKGIREVVVRAARQLAERDLSLDLLIKPASLGAAVELAEAVPSLRIIINHVGRGGDPQAPTAGWKEATAQAAACGNIWMKVSGMVEQVSKSGKPSPREARYYAPVLDHLWQCYGVDRLIYGSNWPVSDGGAPYAAVMQIVQEYFSAKGQQALDKVCWQNTLRFYKCVRR